MSPPARKKRILVADDDLNLRKVMCMFLKGAGYETSEARDGREALDMSRRDMPDLVLLDVMMPVIKGFDVCKMIKSDPDLRSIRIIICTAKSRKEDIVAAIRGGADDYIIKPFTKEVILQKVERVLNPLFAAASGTQQAERRGARRKGAGWWLSWGSKAEGSGLPPLFKGKVLDISVKGVGFIFNRCDICTGYEQGTVHPLCLFSRHATKLTESEDLDLVLNVTSEVVLEVRGRIAHVFQWDDNSKTERVGVAFTQIPQHALWIIEEFIEDRFES